MHIIFKKSSRNYIYEQAWKDDFLIVFKIDMKPEDLNNCDELEKSFNVGAYSVF